MASEQEHSLEFLLAFDGQVQWLAEGYRLKFDIRRVAPTAERPHGLRHAFSLHAPGGPRLMGFDNAPAVDRTGSRFMKGHVATDHWHRTETDVGRLYILVDADTLLADFVREVRRSLAQRGIGDQILGTETRGSI